jgi:hypothetical protein
METTQKLIRRESLEKLYIHLSDQRKIYAPVKTSDGRVEYRYNPGFANVIFDYIRSTLSVKNLVFPKIENLLYFSNTKTETKTEEIDINKIEEIVLW